MVAAMTSYLKPMVKPEASGDITVMVVYPGSVYQV